MARLALVLYALAGGVAIIRVGAATEVEMKEKKHRVEDALSATRAAVEEGIVPGGGVALVRVMSALDDVTDEMADIQTGVSIVRRALEGEYHLFTRAIVVAQQTCRFRISVE